MAEIAELVAGAEVKVADRTTAEKLTNTRLYVERARLPEPEEDEFYLADLVGLAGVMRMAARLGTVTAVHDYGAGASLEIARESEPPLLVPFTRAAVPAVDVSAGLLRVRARRAVNVVMAGPVPAVGPAAGDGTDGRDRPGHDVERA